MVKTRRGTLLSVKSELSTGVAHTRLSKRLKKEDVLKNTQTCSPIGAHHSAAIDCSVDVNNFDGSDQSAVKSIRPRSIPRKPRQMMRKTPYRRQPIADQAVNVLRIEDLATECLIAIFAKVEDQAYVRRVIPLVCKRWASIIKSRSDVWKKITCETSAEETSVDYEKVATWIISRGEGVCTKLEIPQRLFHRDGSQGQFANFLQAILPQIGKSLSSLSVAAKCACSDIESIVQFAKGLTSLELSCLDANLDKRKLRHLSGLRELSELVIRVDDTGSIYYNHSYSRNKECPILGSVTGLPKLREISISYSEHSGDESYLFPRTIGHLSKLEKLSLESPLVVRLPEEFTLLKNLKELSFTWSRCTNFLNSKETWKFFGRLPNLASLSLHRCYFEKISVIEKQRLGRLKRLVLNDTHFSWMGPEGFPEGFFPHLVDLEELVLSSSDLSALPNDIFCLKKLEVLDISDNSIVDMPTWEMYSLPMLESLKTLKAGGNPFPALPRKFLLGCPNLEYLWIEHCENLEISASMSWLFNSNTQLKLVDIHKRSHRFQESSKRWLNELQAKVSETTRKLNYGDLTEYENVQGKKVCSCAIKD